MGLKTTGGYCNFCKKSVMAQGTKPNHILHLVLSILTVGFWLPVWLVVSVAKAGGYRCTTCGNRI